MDISTLILYVVFVAVAFAALQGCRYFIDDLREETRIEVSRLRRVRFADGFSPWLRDILLTAPIRRFDNLVQTSGLKARTEFILLGMILGTAMIMSITNQFLTPSYPLLGLVLGLGLGIVLPYA